MVPISCLHSDCTALEPLEDGDGIKYDMGRNKKCGKAGQMVRDKRKCTLKIQFGRRVAPECYENNGEYNAPTLDKLSTLYRSTVCAHIN